MPLLSCVGYVELGGKSFGNIPWPFDVGWI